MVGVLLECFSSVVVPVFTYKTMVTPEAGPPDNGIRYGAAADNNREAEFFLPDMPADRLMGITAETLRQHPRAMRTAHPILSFAGVNAVRSLSTQTLHEPLEPILALEKAGGWVLLLGVDHCVNTSVHVAEARAGRKRFIRWALTPHGIVDCPNFPGCSSGFQELAPHVELMRRSLSIGSTLVQAFPLRDLIDTAHRMILSDPLALLCSRPDCERCQEVRHQFRKSSP
jgi:aminoglycoside 3-N-acetyltransferase